jgi:hypothetical protein
VVPSMARVGERIVEVDAADRDLPFGFGLHGRALSRWRVRWYR